MSQLARKFDFSRAPDPFSLILAHCNVRRAKVVGKRRQLAHGGTIWLSDGTRVTFLARRFKRA